MFQNWVTKGRKREIEAFNYLICLPEHARGGKCVCVHVHVHVDVCVCVCVCACVCAKGGGLFHLESSLLLETVLDSKGFSIN